MAAGRVRVVGYLGLGVVVFVSLVAFAACATTAGGADEQEKRGGEIVIVVKNQNWRRATIYTTPQFGNRRLGVVAGNSEEAFKLNWNIPRIEIVAEIQDGGTIRWWPVVVQPGEIWTFTIRARQS